jgi:hypothetical protein
LVVFLEFNRVRPKRVTLEIVYIFHTLCDIIIAKLFKFIVKSSNGLNDKTLKYQIYMMYFNGLFVSSFRTASFKKASLLLYFKLKVFRKFGDLKMSTHNGSNLAKIEKKE